MSSSKSSPKTTTTTTDLRTTNALNAGLSGDISEALVAAGNYGDTSIFSMSDSADRSVNDYSDRRFTDNTDNSFRMDLADNSDRSYNDNSDRSYNDYSDRSFTDNADNSLKVEMADNSDRSHYQTSEFADYSDNSMTVQMTDESDRSVYSYTDSSVTTDGGAFEVIRDLGGQMITMLGENQLETLKAANNLVERSVVSSANLANQSISEAMQIKAGQAVAEPVNQNLKELAKVALIGGAIYAGSKMLRK